MVIFMDIGTLIKKAEADGRLVIGMKSVMSRAGAGNLDNIIFSSNCPAIVKENVSHEAKLSDIPVIDFEDDSSDLGEICKKPFMIAVLGIAKKE